MTTDYAEKERDFIAGLHEDTGRDLDSWMSAIRNSGLSERNAIIDWLRHQGFQFARASWLERIHHNGGRLIYADFQGITSRPRRAIVITEEPPDRDKSREPISRMIEHSALPQTAMLRSSEVQKLLSEAKGLRPLAEHVLREIERIVPNVDVAAAPPTIRISSASAFAALLPAPKMLRLFAKFSGSQSPRILAAESVARTPLPFSQMLLLDDVRSVDDEFRRLILSAAAR